MSTELNNDAFVAELDKLIAARDRAIQALRDIAEEGGGGVPSREARIAIQALYELEGR